MRDRKSKIYVKIICRFDGELAKVNDFLRSEKQQREKIQRERDEISSQKYTVEQELKVFYINCFIAQ